MIITIDGPVGSGKSTIARTLAERLGWMFLDTGAMYRTVALAVLRSGVDPENVDRVTELAWTARIGFDHADSNLRVFLDGQEVTDLIRGEAVSQLASKISAFPSVRSALVQKQRELALQYGNIVTEGRDQGSVVFPHAELKIYLDADPAERARRRYDQLRAQGQNADYDKILDALKERDRRDKTRTASPLVVPEGAVVIDTTPLTAGQVLEKIIQLIK